MKQLKFPWYEERPVEHGPFTTDYVLSRFLHDVDNRSRINEIRYARIKKIKERRSKKGHNNDK